MSNRSSLPAKVHMKCMPCCRYLAKECHPDYVGDEGHDLCVLLNEVNAWHVHHIGSRLQAAKAIVAYNKSTAWQAYSVLSNPQQRQRYNARLQEQLQDGLDDYTGPALSHYLCAQ